MKVEEQNEEEHRLEIMIGVLLRFGVILAATVVALGAAVNLSTYATAKPAFGTFTRGTSGLTTISGVLSGVSHFDGRAIIQLGLLLLIATPIARVLFSLVIFLHEKDCLYSFFTLIVFSVLIYSLIAK